MPYKVVMVYGQVQLRTVQSLDCADDVTAMLAAQRLLERLPSCVAVEVWRSERRIGKLFRAPGAPPSDRRARGNRL